MAKGGSYVLSVELRRKGANGEWEKCGVAEVTIDSAAEESVCPKLWAGEFPTVPLQGEPIRFGNASGGKMGHYGSRSITFTPTFQGQA